MGDESLSEQEKKLLVVQPYPVAVLSIAITGFGCIAALAALCGWWGFDRYKGTLTVAFLAAIVAGFGVWGIRIALAARSAQKKARRLDQS